ncbi:MULTISPECIES: hypothetical protein [Acidianus]|uniref:Uncharacterized protein n=1 Tax=Candidatus Acidianus copahuensis TaxID=1160895 RepID=A0A031LL70_9CREN|nr:MULTISPECIES: hypothetical protein [Acidianus]EZQ01653.1 hypothetical protein CM19_12660 [Candidatus Acidianus copahuensis]NON61912.1 hypothetical protein [Acidianus sp. RZ1]
MIRIGRISKDEEEYYFSLDGGKWRNVKVKDKIWRGLKGVKYMEAELDEDSGTVIKRVYKVGDKVISVEYFEVEGGQLKGLTFRCESLGDILSQVVEICENEKIRVFRYEGKFFDDKAQLQNYIVNTIKRQIEQDFVRVNGKIKAETDKAYLLSLKGREVWIPKSLGRLGEEGIETPLWFAKKNSLIAEKEYNEVISEKMKKFDEELSKIPFL